MSEEKAHQHENEKETQDHSKEKKHAPEAKAGEHTEKKGVDEEQGEKKDETKTEEKTPVASKKKKIPKPVPKAEGEKKLETEEVVEEKEKKRVRIRPQLDERTKKALAMKNEMARKRRKFKHQQWNLSMEMDRTGWRKPRGKYSKMRHHQVSQGDIVSIGYRGPALARGMHPSGFREVLVHNAKELVQVDPKFQAIRIAAAVGGRKREEIEERADDLGIHIFNRREDPLHKIVKVRFVADLEELAPERHSLVISSDVSRQMRQTIRSAAKEKGFYVLNPGSGKVKR